MRLRAIVSAGMVALLLLPALSSAQEPGRLSDKDVTQLIKNLDQARDRFQGALDGKIKNAIIRSASGEVDVKAVLGDFEKDVQRLKDRFNYQYAASNEAEGVLRRGAAIDNIMKAQPTGSKGASEWDLVKTELNRLAAVYRTEFPVPEGAAVRRISDKEAADAAGIVVSLAESMKGAVNNDATLAKPDKDALKAELDQLVKQAKVLKSNLSDSKPATADARALRETLVAVLGRPLPASVQNMIPGLKAPLEKLEQGFGLRAPAAR